MSELENFKKGAPVCYGNRYDPVDPALVASGDLKVANLTGWFWIALKIPEVHFFFLVCP